MAKKIQFKTMKHYKFNALIPMGCRLQTQLKLKI